MFLSCEVRWFFDEPPDMLVDWYSRRGLAFHSRNESIRCDFYLRQPRRKDLGIKLREGNVEIKERSRSLGITHFTPSAGGRMEQWRKWSFRLAATREGGTDEVLAITRGTGNRDWMPVFKDRLLVLYEIREEGRVVLLDQSTIIREGCGVEFTRIEAHGKTWYTFGMEAFSAANHSRRNMLITADAFLAELPQLELPVGQSFSYPSFFAGMAG